MSKTRLSLFFPASYLVSSGLGLLAFPQPYLKLLLSRGDYGDAFPRLAGALILGLGIIVVQIARLRLVALYPTILGVRVFFCACWAVLYLWTRDPFFLVLLGVVGFGVVLTSLAFLIDTSGARPQDLLRGGQP